MLHVEIINMELDQLFSVFAFSLLNIEKLGRVALYRSCAGKLAKNIFGLHFRR